MKDITKGLFQQLLQFPTQFFIVLIGFLLFYPQVDSWALFDWDELMPAESTREMLLTGNYRMVQIDFQPFYEKPPLFFWLQSLSMKWWGVNEKGARFINVIVGVFTMLVLFNTGRSNYKSSFGVLWALMFGISVLPQFYFRSGFMHPLYDLLTFLSIVFLYRLTNQNDFESSRSQRASRRLNLLLSALFAGLATLVKGPACLVVIALTSTVYFVVNRGRLKIEITQIFIWWLIAGAVVFAWLGIELNDNGLQFIDGFGGFYKKLIGTHAEGHSGPWFYYLLVILIGMFPASVLMPRAFAKNDWDDDMQRSLKRWMIYLFITVVILFSAAKTKIVHYASLSFFPCSFFAAYYLYYLLEGKLKWTWKQTVPLIMMGVLLVVAVVAAVSLGQRKDVFINYIKDEFAAACVQSDVVWRNAEVWPAILYLISLIVIVLFIQTKHTKLAVFTLLISTGVFINTMLVMVVPKAEGYAQHPMIEFIRQKRFENCVVQTDFRSYAPLFYMNKPVRQSTDSSTRYYIITKVHLAKGLLQAYPDYKELYRKGGYVFVEKPFAQ